MRPVARFEFGLLFDGVASAVFIFVMRANIFKKYDR